MSGRPTNGGREPGNGKHPNIQPDGRTPMRQKGQRRRPEDGNTPPRGFLLTALDPERLKSAAASVRSIIAGLARSLGLKIFYSRERILCGGVLAVLMVFFAMAQTTIFSTIRPFGCSPDLMLSFVLALSITERRRWGAVWGLVCAVLMDSLGSYSVSLLPLLYVTVGYFGGVIANHYLTGSAVVRAILEVGAVILRCVVTAILAHVTPLYASPGEIFLSLIHI